MPIITMQRRLREVGRIRLGEQVATSSGKKRPVKLTKFRLTARDRRIIDGAAQRYGGEVREWAAPDGTQWEVITDAAEMPVVVPPGEMSFSQWYELWSAGGCQRRCDGVHNVLTDSACMCDPDNRECSSTTRLNVLLPEVPGFGLWRLESHGYYAAVELAGVVDLCRRASEAGHMLPARLRLEQRQVKRIDRDGKPTTLKFAVPALDLDVSVSTLGALGAEESMPVGELANPAAALPVASGWSPVPVGELPEAPVQSVAEQLDVRREPRRRSNAAAPLPSTGLKPRTAADAEAGGMAAVAKPKAKQAIFDAVGKSRGRAQVVWDTFFPGDPAEVSREALDEALASITDDDDPGPDGPGEGSPPPMGGEDAETEAPDLGASGEASPSGEPGLSPDLAPDAGEDAAAPADSPADGASIDAATRGRMFALVGELCPDAANLSRAANEEVRKRWLLELASAIDGCEFSSRTQIGDGTAAKVIAAMEHVVDGQASYADFVEGRWQVSRRANGGITVAKRRGRAA